VQGAIAIEAKGLFKAFDGKTAVDGIDIAVPEGSIYGILGPNGAGKTTTLRMLLGIIDPDSGSRRLLGHERPLEVARLVGYLPEERGLYKKLKIGEQLVYLAQLKGMSRKAALDRSKAWMKKFEILDWWNRKVEDLSKGMAQKVQFVSTVMHEPRLIILDEPFSGFDPVNAQLITQEILELRENGSTIIFSTHRMETVEDLCDHIALINKSQKVLEGSKKQVKDTYRTNTFVVEHRGSVTLPGRYELVHQRVLEDQFLQSTIRMPGNESPNQLIRDLTDITEVHSFIEKIPTMSDIFITLVKGQSHE
jgi:ABC-2 type transport system ATP-binding protein